MTITETESYNCKTTVFYSDVEIVISCLQACHVFQDLEFGVVTLNTI